MHSCSSFNNSLVVAEEPPLGDPQCCPPPLPGKVVSHFNLSLVDLCNLLFLGKYFDVMDELLECPPPDAIHTLLGTSSQAQVMF